MHGLDLSSNNLFKPVTENLNTLLHNLPVALVALIIGFIIIRIVSFIASWLIGFVRMPKGLKEIIVSLIDAVLAVFLAIAVLQVLGLSNVAFVVTAVAAGLGIAIGNGAIPIMTDIVSGIYLARDRYFSIGDIVEAGEPGSERIRGEVISMDMRRTRVKSEGGRIHSFPNTVIERHEYALVTKRRDRTDLK